MALKGNARLRAFFCFALDGNEPKSYYFRLFMPDAIRRECGKTYGIHLGQFRLAGVFDQSCHDFIAIGCFTKKKQKNDQRMNHLYEKVDAIRETGQWTREK